MATTKKKEDMTVEELYELEEDYDKKLNDIKAKFNRLKQDELKITSELNEVKYIKMTKIVEDKDKTIKSLQTQQKQQ